MAALEVVAQQSLQLGQHRGRRGVMETVTAVVDPHTGDVERRRHPAEGRGPLDELHGVPGPGSQPRRGETGGPAAEHGDVRQAVTRMRALAKEPTPTWCPSISTVIVPSGDDAVTIPL